MPDTDRLLLSPIPALAFLYKGPTHLWGVPISVAESDFVAIVLTNHLCAPYRDTSLFSTFRRQMALLQEAVVRDILLGVYCGQREEGFVFQEQATDMFSPFREGDIIERNGQRLVFHHAHEDIRQGEPVISRDQWRTLWSTTLSLTDGDQVSVSETDPLPEPKRGVFSEGDIGHKYTGGFKRTGRSLSVDELIAEIDALEED